MISKRASGSSRMDWGTSESSCCERACTCVVFVLASRFSRAACYCSSRLVQSTARLCITRYGKEEVWCRKGNERVRAMRRGAEGSNDGAEKECRRFLRSPPTIGVAFDRLPETTRRWRGNMGGSWRRPSALGVEHLRWRRGVARLRRRKVVGLGPGTISRGRRGVGLILGGLGG